MKATYPYTWAICWLHYLALQIIPTIIFWSLCFLCKVGICTHDHITNQVYWPLHYATISHALVSLLARLYGTANNTPASNLGDLSFGSRPTDYGKNGTQGSTVLVQLYWKKPKLLLHGKLNQQFLNVKTTLGHTWVINFIQEHGADF
jgi:hypothetical protein